ncbi:T9SS type A sorting domain-containing protein [Wenyingzhuangia sp. IMCC45533]
MNPQKILMLIAFVFSTLSYGQLENEANYFTPPANRGIFRTYRPTRAIPNNDSRDLQNLINQVANNRAPNGQLVGGRILIPRGNYNLESVSLRSNVTLLIDELAVIRPAPRNNNGNYSIFILGSNRPERLRNIQIVGTPNQAARNSNPNNPALNGRFTVDLRGTNRINVFVFSCSNVTNFKISNFVIQDRKTKFQSVGLGHTTINGINYAPSFGVISNGSVTDADYGYGLVQIQSGNNILAKNLRGTGGVTLRLETGFSVLQRIRQIGPLKLNKIVGRDIECRNGQAAVHISPHTIDQGVVDVRRIRAFSCEWGVFIERGFTKTDERRDGLTPGSFNGNSIVSGVTSNFGFNATTRAQALRFVPCNLRNRISLQQGRRINGNTPVYITPSLAAVSYEGFTGGNRPGHYRLRLSNVRANGYPVNRMNPINSVPAVITDETQDFEGCGPSRFPIFVPGEIRNTPRRIDRNSARFQGRGAVANTDLKYIEDVELAETSQVSNTEVNELIEVYSTNGNLVLKTNNTSIEDVKSNHPNLKGIYLFKVLNKESTKTKKVVL